MFLCALRRNSRCGLDEIMHAAMSLIRASPAVQAPNMAG